MRKNKFFLIVAIAIVCSFLVVVIPDTRAAAYPVIYVSPLIGPPGTKVTIATVSGSGGFGYNNNLSICLGDVEVAYASADTAGQFSTFFYVPADTTPGVYEIKIYSCGTSFPPCMAPMVTANVVNFTVTAGTVSSTPPAITITPDRGLPGTLITIKGTNFESEAAVRVYFGDVDIQRIFIVQTDGSFSGVFSIPQKDPGSYVVKVIDNSLAGKTATADIQVLVELYYAFDKNRGAVGTIVRASGMGFKANSTVTVKYDDKEIPDAEGTTDAKGGFTIDFRIPASTAGSHDMTITDGSTVKTAKFIMEDTPPPMAVLQGPPVDTLIPGTLYLEWQGVTDDSMPVTYNLQISVDPSFAHNSVILEKKDIKENVYSLTTAEQNSLIPTATALEPVTQDKKYYWGVQAVDAASNKGEWSSKSSFVMPAAKASTPTATTTPSTVAPASSTTPTKMGTVSRFNVPGNLPGWALYLLIAIIALLVLFIGIWIGRKSVWWIFR